MKSLFIVVLLIFGLTFQIKAIIPPKKGVKPSESINQLQQEIRKSYTGGYYAQKMRDRAETRQKIEMGILPPSALDVDTVFALTLLGRYSDSSPIYTREALQTKLFDGPTTTGTVTDYYHEVSYGQMVFTGECKGWYNTPGTMASYVGSNSGLGVNGGPRFVLDVIAASDAALNYANHIQYYDNQGKPHIGFIAVVHTGADAAAGANNIWSHRWTFTVANGGQPYITNDIDPVSGQAVIIDGDYAIQPELKGSNNGGGPIVEIGVFAHEFGHIFGLPDLYDTDNSSEGLGNWCLMAGGTYGGDGSSAQTPTHMSAWCKKEMGWVTPQLITEFKKDFSIPSVTTNPVIYKMWRTSQPGSIEYFLLENRQKTGFDSRLPSDGLLIYHVDESRNSNQNEDRYLVDLEQADGLRNLNKGNNRGDAGDPFPGITQNRNFDFSTTPNSHSYTAGPTYISARNIRLSGGKIIADLGVGTVPYLSFNSLRLEETIPGNGRVEQNETGNLILSLKNLEPVSGNNISVSFSINDPGIEILNPSTVDSIPSLGIKEIKITGAFKLKPEFQSKMIWVKYTVNSAGNTISDSFRVVAGIPGILIVNRSEYPEHMAYYDSALTHLSLLSELHFGNQYPFVSKRDVIIYTTGNKKDSLFSPAEIDSLTLFLTTGGKIFFTGQNIAEYLQIAFPSFLHNRIGLKWVKNNNLLAKNAYGISGDPVGSLVSTIRFNGLDGAGNERSTDVLADSAGFNIAFSYKNTSVEGAAGWNENGLLGSKVFFMGFGFESINNLESSVSRNEIMAVIMNWFDMPTSVSEDLSGKIFGYALHQNYPNPFNPSTNISFELTSAGEVTLSLYDVTGSKISEFYRGITSAGKHTVGLNTTQLGLSSGIYLVRLNSGSFSSSIKIVLLK